ncbi:UDP-N-acetylglucosamine 4,6-dehydratase [Desulfarculus baarsii DSM 2075]|uniref:UDP-N-acetylglucosamine 4,6-dehydratase n=1 Tax=Desulfarculus baarsii (strain ATCC 33931 / DSM 2075 / LMG 7858 / VKM B-1802 / 2st14) TaxID=644282 RepID=E1QFQ4_DESB2|nr:UDP-N-acetylglucosamine 4,6-dehydratase (inverting) [Desulfarculus baarsii]ADK84390.1 UDP-N-acetylglucosamine 4,6-dehydratase [Desulfarculus baarsii DSM 2075]
MFDDKTILITGGTGSFGRKCVQMMTERYRCRKIIVFSRDEFKQFEMANQMVGDRYACLRFFLGDVRDKDRLKRALGGVDYVIHAAAIKQVPAAEYNPFEAVRTNIVGAQNLIDAAIDMGVAKVMALSTDKAANPINLYGATKLCSDKLFVAGNAYVSQDRPTRFSVVRYGNVAGSRGSVIPLFLRKRAEGELPVTDVRMTRFWITLEHAVEFVFNSMAQMKGRELFVPKLPSMRILDLVEAVGPGCKVKVVGIRPGEKIHETLIPRDESFRTVEYPEHYVVYPSTPTAGGLPLDGGGRLVAEEFDYNSGDNPDCLTVEEIRRQVELLFPHGVQRPDEGY